MSDQSPSQNSPTESLMMDAGRLLDDALRLVSVPACGEAKFEALCERAEIAKIGTRTESFFLHDEGATRKGHVVQLFAGQDSLPFCVWVEDEHTRQCMGSDDRRVFFVGPWQPNIQLAMNKNHVEKAQCLEILEMHDAGDRLDGATTKTASARTSKRL